MNVFATLLVCLMLGQSGSALAAAANADFPLYPVIEDNVRFWKDIYTKYSLNTAVIHDKNDLSIIYETVTVMDTQLPGAQKVNKLLLDSKKNHYAAILRKLSRSAPGNAEERRVAALFQGKGSARKMAGAVGEIRVQTGQKERFREGVVRSGAYMPAIRKIFRSYNLPEDLAYLPHVESSFDTKAYSKLGASGIWQFTHSTGKQYLRIDAAVDERGDPLIAAHAAAKYLKNSYNLLGSWPLALTSYNYGTGGMKRALRDKGSYERIFKEYSEGHFKFASRNFYSEFLAALAAAKELESNPAIRLDQPRSTRSVTLKSKATVKEAARHFGVPTDTLKDLNPALRPAVFKGEKSIPRGYALNLPATGKKKAAEPVIAANLAAERKSASGRTHTVKKGDTLSGLARKYRVSSNTILAANDLQGSVLRLGQTLQIPAVKPDSPKAMGASQQSEADVMQKGAPQERSSRFAVSKTTVRNGKHYGRIQVQPGETLKMLATWAAISPATLQRLNDLPDSTVHPGRSLVMTFDKVSPREFQQKRLTSHKKKEQEYFSSFSVVGLKKYTVAAEDTVWEICHKKFTIPIWLLQKYNASKDLTDLRSSMELVIPIVRAI